MNLNKKLDIKHEEILQKAIEKFGSYHQFINEILDKWITNELMYDNINDDNENYDYIKNSYTTELKKIIKDPYSYNIDKKTLISLNKKFFLKGIRDKKIIHRPFLHEIESPQDIDLKLDSLFLDLSKEKVSLDNYFVLLYNLYKIYPFWNAITIRLFSNIYLLQNEYIPLIPFMEFKSEYYDSFRYGIFRFKKQFSKYFLENGDIILRFVSN